MHLRYINFYSLILTTSLLFFIISTSAQNIKRYSGNYIIDDSLSGKASFEYYKKGSDTIKHGKFSFQTSEYNYNQNNLFSGMVFNGTFKNGNKHGRWNYRFVRFNLNTQPRLNNYEVTFQGNGKEYMVSAGFRSGKPFGIWHAIQRTITAGQPRDTMFLARARYKNEMMNGDFKARDDHMSLQGSINDEGFLDGKWTFMQNGSDAKMKEQRYYDNGILKKHFLYTNHDTVALHYTSIDTTMNNENEVWDIMPAGSTYLKIINIATSAFQDSIPAKHLRDSTNFKVLHTNTFMNKAFSAFHTHEKHTKHTIWNMVNGSDAVTLPKVRVRKFPLSDKEQKKLQQISDRFNSVQHTIAGYFEDAQIDISRHAYKDVQYYYKLMKLYQDRLHQLKPVVDIFNMPAFAYFNRDSIMQHIVPHIAYPDTIKFEFEEKKHTRVHAFPQDLKKGEPLDTIDKHLKHIHKQVSKTTERVNRILKEYKKEKRLAGKEEQLIQARDSVMALFNSKSQHNDYNKYHKKLTENIRKFYEQAFKSYATMSLEEKINEVSILIDCFEEALKLYEALAVLPEKLDRLDEKYTHTTWNPYTYTHMDERIKKPLYKAFNDKILPFLLQDLQSGLECGKIEKKARNFDTLYKKMLDLQQQKTDHIEKQVRKADTPEEIISIMDIKLNIN